MDCWKIKMFQDCYKSGALISVKENTLLYTSALCL